MKKIKNFDTVQYPTTLIIGVQTPSNFNSDIESYFEEFRNLIDSNQIHYDHDHYVKLRSIDPAYFFTKGKLHEIITLCEENNIEEIIISEPLSNQQQRNLRRILHAQVFDRTELILEIFEKGAQSAEGKLQVAIAMLQHKKARLAGRGIHLSQQDGRIGGRGPGETKKEMEDRHIERLINKHTNDLKHLEQIRATQRKQRQRNKIVHISLIGYTNAGKSTLLNTLTKSEVLAEDRLFATLDTTTRELFINGEKKGVLSDTVGFIQQLPHKLINAFKSTLTELQYSDLLLHVIDISNSNWQEQNRVVQEILNDLEVSKPLLNVFNKIDCIDPEQIEQLNNYIKNYEPYVIINATTKEGVEPLIEFLNRWKPLEL